VCAVAGSTGTLTVNGVVYKLGFALFSVKLTKPSTVLATLGGQPICIHSTLLGSPFHRSSQIHSHKQRRKLGSNPHPRLWSLEWQAKHWRDTPSRESGQQPFRNRHLQQWSARCSPLCTQTNTFTGPSHEILSALPFLGDTTSNQALLFSPPFSNVNATPQPPTYPNYILPPANPPLPSLPQGVQAPNFTLVLDSTSTSSLTTIPQTGCRLLAAPTPNMELALQPWLRDEDGWRIRFLAQGLTPATNYTAYIVQSGTKVSGPIYFATKSGIVPSPCFSTCTR
jgi:hypothetical protein